MNGLEAAKKIIATCPDTLVLTDSFLETDQLIDALKAARVRGFVSKLNLVTDLVPAMEAVLSGGMWFPTAQGTSTSASPE
jgi:DNA-binding NarL/FixJ family response regulator